MGDRLAEVAAAARKTGMSYGQYMAMMQGKPRPEPMPEPKGSRVCVVCGSRFFGKGKKICCSGACADERETERNRIRREKARAQK